MVETEEKFIAEKHDLNTSTCQRAIDPPFLKVEDTTVATEEMKHCKQWKRDDLFLEMSTKTLDVSLMYEFFDDVEERYISTAIKR